MSTPESLKFRSATQVILLLFNTNTNVQTCVKINMCRSSSELIRYVSLGLFLFNAQRKWSEHCVIIWTFREKHCKLFSVHSNRFSHVSALCSRTNMLTNHCVENHSWPKLWDPTRADKIGLKSVFRFHEKSILFLLFPMFVGRQK